METKEIAGYIKDKLSNFEIREFIVKKDGLPPFNSRKKSKSILNVKVVEKIPKDKFIQEFLSILSKEKL